MAGVPVAFDWGYFPETVPCFPAELTEAGAEAVARDPLHLLELLR